MQGLHRVQEGVTINDEQSEKTENSPATGRAS